MDDINTDVPQTGLTRREMLKRGLAVGATLAWAAPVVQVIGIRPAYAAQPSSGCTRYCLKWEPGGQSRGETCPPTEQGELPPEGALLPWIGLWSSLGGKPTTTTTLAAQTPEDSVPTDPDGAPGASGEAGKPSSPEEAGNPSKPESRPDRPPHNPPGNCLECPEGDFAINQLPGGISLDHQVAVYGSPEAGFLVTYPAGWKLADLDIGSPVAAKCGSEQSSEPPSSWCNTNYQIQTAPCEDPGRAGFSINPCANGHAISHLELILDIC